MLNIEYLRSFVTLAQIGKYHLAAEELYISQSTLSKQIQALEKELGVQLFDRSTHQVSLTEYATVLLPHARKMLETYQRMERDLQKVKIREQRESILIGCSPVIPLYRLTNIVSGFLQECPCEIKISNVVSSRLREQLAQGQFDIVILYSKEEQEAWEGDQIDHFSYTKDRLAAVLPSNHKLAGHSSLSLMELQNDVFVQVGSDPISETFRLPERIWKDDFSPETGFRVDTVHQMMDVIRRGMGISVIGEQSAKHFNNSGTVTVPIEPEIPLCVKGFCHKAADPRSAAKKLISYLMKTDN